MRISKIISKWTVLFGILTILSMVFIFYNSIQGPAESEERSLAIVEQVKPFLDAEDRLTEKAFNDMVRAMAHLAEFALLGFSLGGLFVSAREWSFKKLVERVLAMALLVAVADEILQYFTGRYTDVKDVALDVFGAFLGVMVVNIGMGIIKK